jgi:CRISPR-associated endoribonuclease Cas6
MMKTTDNMKLYSLLLYFTPRADLELKKDLGASLHAFFFNLLRGADKNYASEVHTAAGTKPFTVSPVKIVDENYLSSSSSYVSEANKNKRQGRRYRSAVTVISSGSLCQVRLTLLDARTFFSLAHGFIDGVHYLHINGVPVDIVQTQIVPDNHNCWAGYSEYRELWENAQPHNRVFMEFLTPTTFRQGDINLPLPVPRLVFGSLAAKWRYFAPEYELHPDLNQYLEQKLALGRFNVRSAILNYGRNRKYVGFEGTCTYILRGNTRDADTREIIRQVNMLANYAFYAGVGQKTTMGMGQARRYK